MESEGLVYHYTSRIQMPSAKWAEIVLQATCVDPELRPEEVQRNMAVQDSSLVIEFHAKSARTLRTAVTSLYDFVRVSLVAIKQFGSEES